MTPQSGGTLRLSMNVDIKSKFETIARTEVTVARSKPTATALHQPEPGDR